MKRRNKLFSAYFNNYLLFYFQDESVWQYGSISFLLMKEQNVYLKILSTVFWHLPDIMKKSSEPKEERGIVKEQTVFVLSCILLFQKSYILIFLRTISDPMKSENLLILHVIMYFKLTCFML